MTTRDRVQNDYFEWMLDIVDGERDSEEISYRKLLTHLHCTDFVYSIPMDENRASDGLDLRYRYSLASGDDKRYLDIGPCTVLEMMIALAIRCEEEIMSDPDVGDRTRQWFWTMVNSLGLGAVTDARYDKALVNDILTTFLDREYEPNGRGGLFYIRNCEYDLRDVEIWYQLSWYLNSIT